jgi:hypothetical protein
MRVTVAGFRTNHFLKAFDSGIDTAGLQFRHCG